MARSIQEIYDDMVTVKNNRLELARLTSNSSSAIWRLILYVVAVGIHTLEKIFDTHRDEVNEIIQNILPHRPKWYRDKALKFMVDTLLIPDTDIFDTEGMSDEEIEAARVVKYAVATEEQGSSVLIIKTATGEPGYLQPLPPEQEEQFRNYIAEIRDAGVAFNVVNLPGDFFKCTIDVYYSPLLLDTDVERAVKEAIKFYLTGLPFNGEYSNMALIDAVQLVDGVRIAEFRSAESPAGNFINAKTTPASGYFSYVEENITINTIPHNAI